jgi:toxin CcdB
MGARATNADGFHRCSHAPIFEIEGLACFLETPKLAAIPVRILRMPVASLAQSSAAIVGAMDFLFQGF